MSLELLLHPHGVDTFFREVWETSVLHVARNDPSYFSFLREDLPIEQVLWQTCHNWGDVSLARSRTSYESAPYAALPPNVATIRKAWEDDYTIVINNVERKSIRVARFCREVEKQLYFNSIINLYYTRANSQGLDYHYDTEDVFILQLEGTKEWRIYEKKADLPLSDGLYEPQNCDLSPFVLYSLHPGDVLYIPRGVIHEARTNDLDSIHLSLTVSVIRWSTFLQQLITLIAQKDVDFRKAIPLELLTNKNHLVRNTVDKLLNKLNNESYLTTTTSAMQDELLVVKQRLPLNSALDNGKTPEVDLESKMQIAPDQVFLITKSYEGISLKFIGASIQVSDELEESIQFICQHKTFRVREVPKSLSDLEKLALVRQLVLSGFLVGA